jgi:hypothetical protein
VHRFLVKGAAAALVALLLVTGMLVVGQRQEASATEILQFYTELHDSSNQNLSNPIAANISVHDYAYIQVTGAPPLGPSTAPGHWCGPQKTSGR